MQQRGFAPAHTVELHSRDRELLQQVRRVDPLLNHVAPLQQVPATPLHGVVYFFLALQIRVWLDENARRFVNQWEARMLLGRCRYLFNL